MAKPALQLVDKESGVDKQKALETALANIERSFGKGSVMRLGDKQTMDIEAVSTGSLGLDIALGIVSSRAARRLLRLCIAVRMKLVVFPTKLPEDCVHAVARWFYLMHRR